MMITSGLFFTRFGLLAVILSNTYKSTYHLAIPYSTTLFKNIKMFFAKFIDICLYAFSMAQSHSREAVFKCN